MPSTTELWVKIAGAIDSSFGGSMDMVTAGINRVSDSVKSSGAAIGQWSGGIINSLSTIGGNLSSNTKFWASYANTAASSLLGISGHLQKVAADCVATAASFEQQQAKLTTVMHSASAAAKQMQEAIEYSRKTPFTVDTIVDATVKLRVFGQDANHWLPLVADLAAGMGKSMDYTGLTVAKALSGSRTALRSLRDNFGILQQDLGRFGAVMDKQGRVVLKTREETEKFSKALEALIRMNFPGAVERQMTTLNGILSNLKDRIILVANAFGQEMIPAAKATVGVMTDVLTMLERMPAPLKQVIAFGGSLAFMTTAAAGGFLMLGAGIQRNLTSFGQLAIALAGGQKWLTGWTASALLADNAALSFTATLGRQANALKLIDTSAGYLGGGAMAARLGIASLTGALAVSIGVLSAAGIAVYALGKSWIDAQNYWHSTVNTLISEEARYIAARKHNGKLIADMTAEEVVKEKVSQKEIADAIIGTLSLIEDARKRRKEAINSNDDAAVQTQTRMIELYKEQTVHLKASAAAVGEMNRDMSAYIAIMSDATEKAENYAKVQEGTEQIVLAAIEAELGAYEKYGDGSAEELKKIQALKVKHVQITKHLAMESKRILEESIRGERDNLRDERQINVDKFALKEKELAKGKDVASQMKKISEEMYKQDMAIARETAKEKFKHSENAALRQKWLATEDAKAAADKEVRDAKIGATDETLSRKRAQIAAELETEKSKLANKEMERLKSILQEGISVYSQVKAAVKSAYDEEILEIEKVKQAKIKEGWTVRQAEELLEARRKEAQEKYIDNIHKIADTERNRLKEQRNLQSDARTAEIKDHVERKGYTEADGREMVRNLEENFRKEWSDIQEIEKERRSKGLSEQEVQAELQAKRTLLYEKYKTELKSTNDYIDEQKKKIEDLKKAEEDKKGVGTFEDMMKYQHDFMFGGTSDQSAFKGFGGPSATINPFSKEAIFNMGISVPGGAFANKSNAGGINKQTSVTNTIYIDMKKVEGNKNVQEALDILLTAAGLYDNTTGEYSETVGG